MAELIKLFMQNLNSMFSFLGDHLSEVKHGVIQGIQRNHSVGKEMSIYSIFRYIVFNIIFS